MYIYSVLFECKSTNLLLLKLKKLTSGLLKNMEQNKLLLNLENFTSHCLKNPEMLLVLLIGPLLIGTYCVYPQEKMLRGEIRHPFLEMSAKAKNFLRLSHLYEGPEFFLVRMKKRINDRK